MTRGLTRHLSQAAQDYQTAEHRFREAQKTNFEGCADRLEKDTDYRKCMHEECRTQHRKWTWENPQHDAEAKAQAQIGNQWNVVKSTAGGSDTIPTRQHPEHGQAHRARMNYQCAGRVAKQEIPLRKHSDFERCFFGPHNAIKNLAI